VHRIKKLKKKAAKFRKAVEPTILKIEAVPSSTLHGVTSHNIVLLTDTAVET
jgi:hypothetical protein